ncbi:hypothetical protein JTB14_033299 [Gonioctena quinquepunctata]|nr:hypothetical protein JTB14_033299 [Gonioctena quinquepunctata]
MEEQVEAGRTKTIGLSNFNIAQIDKVLKSAKIKPACLQVELHVFLQQPELVNFCHDNDIVVVAYSPLGSPAYNKFLKILGQEEKRLPSILDNPLVCQIAAKYNKSNGQVALRFLLQKNIVVIPKSVNASRIRENFDVFDFKLDAHDMGKLETLDLGEEARICDFKIFPKFQEHPEWPFGK